MSRWDHLDRQALALTALVSGEGAVRTLLFGESKTVLRELVVRAAVQDAERARAESRSHLGAVDRLIERPSDDN